MPKPKDLTGKTFGNLLVIEEVEPRCTEKHKYRRWKCKCLKCNNHVIIYGNNLSSGHTTQCKRCSEKQNLDRTTHGMRHTRLYKTWVSIKARCLYPSAVSYERYGALGITVCDEWANDFSAFAKWALANGFIEDAKPHTCTIDRIDPSKGYSPDNCRFTNSYVQSNNRSCNIVIVDTDGETLTLKQAAQKHDLDYPTVYSRWYRGTRDVRALLSQYNTRTGERISPFR